MDSLPPELLSEVLSHVPKRSLLSCRLVCRTFCTLSFRLLFAHIPKWLDYTISHRAVISLAHDAFNRPTVMWSPWAMGPDKPVDEVWMRIVWKILIKTDPPALGENFEGSEVVLTGSNFAELSGREEMSENRLRTGQNRYLLHRTYTEDRSDAKYLDGGIF